MVIKDDFELGVFLSYCQSFYKRDQAFDYQQTDRLTRHRHLEPESAKFLSSLVLAKGPKSVLEIGTSTGYSTLWLAYGLRHQSDTQFVSLDIDCTRSEIARTHLQAVGLAGIVTLIVQNALDFLEHNHHPFDFIFLDAERGQYLTYCNYLHASLLAGSVLIVDNVISHADEVSDFIMTFDSDSRYLCTTLPLGSGLFMAVRQDY